MAKALTKVRTIAALIAVVVAISVTPGCTSQCSTNPGEVSRLCGAAYQLGANKQLEEHLAERQQVADSMKQDVQAMRASLEQSKERLARTELRLRATNAKTAGARDQARKLAAEFSLKRLDIEERQAELARLEQRADALKRSKSEKQEDVLALRQAQAELKQTKSEVDDLQAYLAEDLLIRAENALAYD